METKTKVEEIKVGYPEEVLKQVQLLREKAKKHKEEEETQRLQAEEKQLQAEEKQLLTLGAFAAWTKALGELRPGARILWQVKPLVWTIKEVDQIDFIKKEMDLAGVVIYCKGDPVEQGRRAGLYKSTEKAEDLCFIPILESEPSSKELLREIFGPLIVVENTESNSVSKKRKHEDD
jgi:hypothetical protein